MPCDLRLGDTLLSMYPPDTPTELISAVTDARAREVFEEFDNFTPPMQEQARLLMRVCRDGELNDVTFRDILALTLYFWRDCNQARFKELHMSQEEFSSLVRSVQIDQFINGWMLALSGIPELLDDFYGMANEPDGS